jgi:hypothetical protein
VRTQEMLMATYRLDQLEGGVVRLASGGWRWYVIRLNSLPEQVCHLQQLIFVGEQDGVGIMRARVPNDINTIDDAAAMKYALHPEDRIFRIDGRSVTVRPPTDRSVGAMWDIWPETGGHFRNDHAIEKPLGELTREDMIQLCRL